MTNGTPEVEPPGGAAINPGDAQPPESAPIGSHGERSEDWDEASPTAEPLVVTTENVSGKDLLVFAQKVLCGLAILAIVFPLLGFLGPILVNHIWPVTDCAAKSVCDREVDGAIRIGESLIDLSRTAIPSLATLVIGFYFGQKLK